MEDGQNDEQELNDRNNNEDIKTTEKIRDEEESFKKDINEKKEYTTVRNNKDTDGILKLHQASLKVNRENNQTLKMYKMEQNNW